MRINNIDIIFSEEGVFKNIRCLYFVISELLIISAFFSFQTLSYAQEKWSEPLPLKILNSEADEFAPAWNHYEKALYFNSDREGYSYFYKAFPVDSTFFSIPQYLRNGINKTGENQSYITFAGVSSAFLSAFKLYENRSYLNIFTSQKQKNAWEKPVLLDSLSGRFFASHPAVSPDGSYMIFVTDRGNKKGDTDLWIAFNFGGGAWGGAESLSLHSYPDINTTGSEITPFIGKNDTLFFSSSGRKGFTGSDFDIYYSPRIDGKWRSPRPLSDINGPSDDSDFILIPGGKAVFASNRAGSLDLFLSERTYTRPSSDMKIETEIGLSTELVTVKAEIVKQTIAANPYILLYHKKPVVSSYFPENVLHHLIIAGSSISNEDFESSCLKKLHSRITRKMNLTVQYFVRDTLYAAKVKTAAERYAGYLKKNFELENISVKRCDKRLNVPVNSAGAVFLSSKNSSFFKPVEIQDSIIGIKTEPEKLNIFINAEKDIPINNWRLSAFLNGGRHEIMLSGGDTFQNKINVDMTVFDRLQLVNTDEILLRYSAGGDNAVPDTSYRIFLLSHVNESIEKLHTDGGEEYYEFYLFSFTGDFLKDDFNLMVLNYFLSFTDRYPIIEITCFDEGSKSSAEDAAEFFKNDLKKNSTSIKTEASGSIFRKNLIRIRLYAGK